MKDYNITVQPGKVVKETYTKVYTQVVEQKPPSASGFFEAPYVAKIDVPLGKEKILINTDNGEFNVRTVKYVNTTKSQRLLNLGRVVGKIVSTEVKSIFGKDYPAGLTYTGLPKEIDETVEKARENYKQAMAGYIDALNVPSGTVNVINRDVLTITSSAVKIDTETLDNKL